MVPFQKKEPSALLMTMFTNCDDRFGRGTLIERLMKHMPVHNYGSCFRNRNFPPNVSDETVVAQYKFIYAVENSLCTEYISEKWVRGLRVGTIPVVASINGVPDYKKFDPALNLPTHINTAGFDGPGELAQRLKKIGGNEKLYSRYMAYRYLPRDKLNPSFVEAMDELKDENRAVCRFARFVKKDGRLNFTEASRTKAHVKESCLFTKIIRHL